MEEKLVLEYVLIADVVGKAVLVSDGPVVLFFPSRRRSTQDTNSLLIQQECSLKITIHIM